MDANNNLSPINVMDTVQKFMTKEQYPLEKLKRAEKKQEVELSAYGQLQGLIQTFQTNLQQVSATFNAVNYQINSTNPAVATALINGANVAPTTHTLAVTQLAQANTMTSSTFTSNTNSLNITDSLSLTVGTNNFMINVGPNDSLQNVRDNINNAFANTGVSASILSSTATDGSSQYQLVISANQTGTANAVSVVDSGNNFNLTQTAAAADANFTFDNQPVVRSSNYVTDVLDGLNINLTSVGSSNITITTAEPTAQITNATASIQTLLSSYNAALAYIDEQQANPQTRNETFSLLKLSLQTAMTSAFTGSGPFTSLSDIGIVVSNDEQNKKTTSTTFTDKNGKQVKRNFSYTLSGQLKLNTDPLLPSLSTALSTNFAAVNNFLNNSQNGILIGVNSLVDPLTGTITDTMRTNTNILNEREKKYVQLIADEDVRLQGIEQRYIKKFSALNVLLEKLQKTTDYLTTQLRNLDYGHDK